jgi:DoxX-like family
MIRIAKRRMFLEERFPIARFVMRGVLAVFFGSAGIAHLVAPSDFLKITPDWVPFGSTVIAVTGLVELACAAAPLRDRCDAWPASHWPSMPFAFGLRTSSTLWKESN